MVSPGSVNKDVSGFQARRGISLEVGDSSLISQGKGSWLHFQRDDEMCSKNNWRGRLFVGHLCSQKSMGKIRRE